MIQTCILFGGRNSEHEVSLRSASSVLRNIPRDRYQVHMLGITKDGRWLHYTGDIDSIEAGTWANGPNTCPAVLSPDCGHRGILRLEPEGTKTIPIDVVFPVLHGKNGEDGTMQGLLELSGIPYVGCGVLGSALCMDKAVAHDLLVTAGVPKTKLMAICKEDAADMSALEKQLQSFLGYPMFVKPANAGSSVGVTKVEGSENLKPALDLAFEHDHKVVVEQEIKGQEIECSVMGNDNPIASDAVGEIVPTTGFYDYAAKYLNDTAGLLVPANVDEAVAQKVREVAVTAYKALCCKGFARVDFFVQPDGSPVLNEINTIPGFTSISMFPKLFAASGVPYPELIHRLLQYAME